MKIAQKIALIHDCLHVFGGAEKVLNELLHLFPEADLFSLTDFFQNDSPILKRAKTSFIQHLPLAKKYFRFYLPLMPLAIENLDLSAYDLVISSSYLVAKGVMTHPHQLHICYCHSPMRYVWDLQNLYLKEMGLKAFFAKYLFHRLRLWDVTSSFRVDKFIANSHFIQSRIQKYYRREASVVYPPVDVEKFLHTKKKEDFYLTCSRLVAYKKVDLIIQAFNQMKEKKLVVIGDGPEFKKLQKMASANVTMLGNVDESVVQEKMQTAKAFVFAAKEDFGISPIEAQSAGVPVIAFGEGGALETIKGLDNREPTGCFFFEQNVGSICHAIDLFEANSSRIKAEACRKNAEAFSKARFRKEFLLFVEQEYQNFQKGDYESRLISRRERAASLASF